MTRYPCISAFAPAFVVAVVFLTHPARAATLVGHWSLDEGTGTTAADSSVNNLDGTLVGPGVT